MKTLNRLTLYFVAVVLVSLSAYGQATMTQTTLSAAVANTDSFISVASATGISVGNLAYVDREAMLVSAINGTVLSVIRGWAGTTAGTIPGTGHASGAVVYVGTPAQFFTNDPQVGTCTASNYPVSPMVAIATGRVWTCVNSNWMLADGLYVLPTSACVSTVSGNATGTQGLTVVGASNTSVVQASTSATGTNTHTYQCDLSLITRLRGNGVYVLDVTAAYGVQTSALGTQAAVLASGTFNGNTVFTSITLPTPAASQTASTVTPVRADSGTITILPVAASFNTATTTAGAFYTARFTPGAPFYIGTDLTQFFFNMTLQNTATSITITNVPNIIVRYAYQPNW